MTGSPIVDAWPLLRRHHAARQSRLESVIDDGASVFDASPDGRTVALHAREDRSILWVYELDSGDLMVSAD